MNQKYKGKIFLLPTFISGTSDLSEINPKTINYINESEFIIAENIKTARRFISKLKRHLNIGEPQIETISFKELDKKTSTADIYELALDIQGKTVSIMSESGCPGIADPGADLIKICHELEIEVVPVSGPSSIFLALMSSGLNGQQFKFNGYLPIQQKDREKSIKRIEKESSLSDTTQIFIETPYRNQKLLETLLKTCNPNTIISVSIDLLGKTQLIKSATVAKWRKESIIIEKLPCVFLLKGH